MPCRVVNPEMTFHPHPHSLTFHATTSALCRSSGPGPLWRTHKEEEAHKKKEEDQQRGKGESRSKEAQKRYHLPCHHLRVVLQQWPRSPLAQRLLHRACQRCCSSDRVGTACGAMAPCSN